MPLRKGRPPRRNLRAGRPVPRGACPSLQAHSKPRPSRPIAHGTGACPGQGVAQALKRSVFGYPHAPADLHLLPPQASPVQPARHRLPTTPDACFASRLSSRGAAPSFPRGVDRCDRSRAGRGGQHQQKRAPAAGEGEASGRRGRASNHARAGHPFKPAATGSDPSGQGHGSNIDGRGRPMPVWKGTSPGHAARGGNGGAGATASGVKLLATRGGVGPA